MRSRGFTCLILGMWLAGGLSLAYVGGESLRGVDRILGDAHPSAAVRIQKLGVTDSQMLLRYAAAEQYRQNLEVWETAQILLAALFFFYLLFATSEDKFALGMALGLLTIVALQRFLLTPDMTALGRLVDFVPYSAPSVNRDRYQVLHATYIGTEIAKWLVQLGLAALVIFRSRSRSRHSGRQLNVVDKADHRHVNG